MNNYIDKDSPGNLSDRDKPIYERWLKNKWSITYSEYLETDHWAVVVKENAIRWKVCVLSRTHIRLPMATHHRDDPRAGYPCMWKEVLDDVVLVCKDCHERHHDIWPEVNCKGSKYAGSMIISMAREHMNEVCEKNGRPISGMLKFFGELLKDCQSTDRELRKSRRWTVGKFILSALDEKYNHSAVIKTHIKFYLIDAWYLWRTTGKDLKSRMKDYDNEPIEEYKKDYFIDNISDEGSFILSKLEDLNVYEEISIIS